MIAYADTTRFLRIGIFVSLWGFLLGAFAIHSTGVMASARSSLGMLEPELPGQDVALRRPGEIELESDAAGRREYELQLELMLRRQMEQVLREQVAELRRDIAGLRREVLEAVDGRLRLERVETTRIIGSDLAALHDEVQRLHHERGTITRDGGPIPISSAPVSMSASGPPSPAPRTELWTPTAMSAATDRGALPSLVEPAPSESRTVDPEPVKQPPVIAPITAASAVSPESERARPPRLGLSGRPSPSKRRLSTAIRSPAFLACPPSNRSPAHP